MKKLYTLFLGLLTSVSFAQQQGQYSQYMMNNYTMNPALSGTEDYLDIKAGFRTQWVGFDAAPKTFYVSGHTALGKQNLGDQTGNIKPMPFHGVGAMIQSDATGPASRTSFYLSYAYQIPLTTKLTASVGVFGGMQSYSIDESKIKFHDATDDPVIDGKQSKVLPDATLGVWLYSKQYYFGFSSFQLLKGDLGFSDLAGTTNNGSLSRHYFVSGGYKVDINDDLFIVPSVVLKTVSPAPMTIDINAKVKYKDLYWGGISWRSQDAIVVLAGMTIQNKIDVGYSYDFTTSDLSNYSSGSHEILIGYRFPYSNESVPSSQFW